MFSDGSSRSISLLTVTASLVTVGPPKDLSMMTLRPVGPRVSPTAWASLSAPTRSFLRASSVYRSCFAINVSPLRVQPRVTRVTRIKKRPLALIGVIRVTRGSIALLDHLREDVGLAHDFQFPAV